MTKVSLFVEEEPRCLLCGGTVYVSPDCPGYGNPVMVCSPGCGNTQVVECDDCDWWYAYPWNRGNLNGYPMGDRPEWYTEAP